MDSLRQGWSLPIGRVFGIQIRIHLLFLLFIVGDLWNAGELSFKYVALMDGILFGSVLLHEFGHCFAARRLGGRAESILLWPLGGLATVDVPRNWRAQFWCSFGGPVVNLLIGAACYLFLHWRGVGASLNPIHFLPPSGFDLTNFFVYLALFENELLLLFNLIPAFPLDGGGMLRAILWRNIGYVPASLIAIRLGKIAAMLLAGWALFARPSHPWAALVALYCFYACEQERIALEMGATEDGFMGYDFSNGYTSLEASSPRPARRGSIFKRMSRWLHSRRAERRMRREKDEELEVKSRVDSLLEKIAREGMTSLSEQEREFLRDASKYYHM